MIVNRRQRGVVSSGKVGWRAAPLLLLLLTLALMACSARPLLEQGFHLVTDLSALLPHDTHHETEQLASERMLAISGNQIILLFVGPDISELKQVARRYETDLLSSFAVQNVLDDQTPEVFQHQVAWYRQHRWGLLSDAHRQLLIEGNVDALLAQSYERLFALDGGMAPYASLSDDPLGLFDRWMQDTYAAQGRFSQEDGLLYIHDTAQPAVALILLMPSGGLDIAEQERFSAHVSVLHGSIPPGVSLYRSGLVFHSANAAMAAKSEITWIAFGSTLGIILIFLITFRSLLPLWWSLAAIGFGCLAAVLVVHWWYGGIHLITLVFGASLIGVVVDYSLHYFAALYDRCPPASTRVAMRQVLPGIALGLLTTVVGYGCLWQSSFPGLQQVALFSAVGLTAAWVFVVAVFPLVSRPVHRTPPRILALVAEAPARFWRVLGARRALCLLAVLGLAAVVFVVIKLQWSASVKTLHKADLTLVAEQQHIQHTLRGIEPNQYYLVVSSTPEALLEQEEVLRRELDELMKRGGIGSYEAVSRYVPSLASQHRDYDLMDKLLYRSGQLPRYLRGIGMESAAIQAHLHAHQNVSGYLQVDQWLLLANPVLSGLWLGEMNGQYVSIVGLREIHDASALSALADKMPNVVWVNRVARLSMNLNEQREQAVRWLLIAYLGIFVLASLRYRRLSGGLVVVVPLLASIITLGLFAFSSVVVGLFHVFGLFLVLGLGMDYAIFMRESAGKGGASHLAIFLSALTSALSFGLLSLSSMPMIQSFGLTVLSGTFLCVLLAPIMLRMTDAA